MKLMLTLILLTINSLLFAPEINQVAIVQGEPIKPFESIWRAVCLVESSGRADAYNTEEGAVGIAQIRKIRIDDFNNRAGKNYKLIEMYDTTKAKEVFMWYCRDPYDLDEIPLNWNCRSRPYLLKVKRELTKL
jgi:hypothetical protein